MKLVLDASATLAWMYREGRQEELDRLYRELSRSGAIVPQLWRLEVVNVLLIGLRKGRHDLIAVKDHLLNISSINIMVDETHSRAWDSVLELAAKHTLTSYDAAYLELAMRTRFPLATLDKSTHPRGTSRAHPAVLARARCHIVDAKQ